ncbi:type IV pilus twitching motility protein PilT [Lentibacillus cibarius]|uniref:Type IV pilus twitching motility protein PilT n=1 Tax=Lentibacillus cibarius TaxID=2583219 RepID=A0A549YF22_9BACI|nr:type IV pilus twitching motility protein PilT [Lentibacillus cibarius]TMN21587.1 type IV pilus twitching motility protein PilT [Lentibacillus cibarius]TRM10490.1 type IV pilus twitching motility protein PilT [Lentibacillus cibarius]
MDDILQQWLTQAFHQKASDVHITVGKAPVFRINGLLLEQDFPVLQPSDTERMGRSLLSDHEWQMLQERRELDFSCGISGVSRFRVNLFYQRGALSLAFRIVPRHIPSIEELHLPPIAKEITTERQGLVLVTGPTGSGKSTTLAAMLDFMNQTMGRHMITLEDPIEYVHTHHYSIIDQREIGIDTNSFLNGLRASLRQDPDVILVGELRDLETISTAITAAETGHLVLGTLHTSGAVSTIERMIDVFPPAQQTQIRIQLASILKAVISQQLLPTTDGTSRRVATEVLINTPAVKNLINNEKLHQIQNVLQTSKAQGMHTMDMDLKRLLNEGVVAYETVAPFLEIREV